MNRELVKKALHRVIDMADYDLAKSLDPEINESGEDGWPELVDIFINTYEKEC
jgi:hypothetical protein